MEVESEEAEQTVNSNLGEVERILKEIDLNNLSPMQALMVLSDLVEKVK